ncbi:MAG: TauD/TfdA family dioxygenase [Rhodocyclales bacterium]|nr:TauD/TfdA family dioxygenase [Rhodocyclales bacterium]
MRGPFDLNDLASYRQWREHKLDSAPRRIEDILVPLDDPRALTARELAALLERCATANMAIYTSNTVGAEDKEIPRRLGAQLGLQHLDSHWLTDDDAISPISVRGAEERGERKEFIPYTDKPIRWHTDGYYNVPQRTVRGLILHCVQSAAAGGDNQLLDHEIAYILLRDENPDHIRALSQADAMTIPPRSDENGVARAAQPGPVFSIDGEGFLHMRYTARTISIEWRSDAATQAAVAALTRILAAPVPWTLHGRLEPGMGLVCNNVLHDRSGFTETPQRRRLLYRARYHERVAALPATVSG